MITFRLHDERLGHGVHRILDEQIDQAVAELRGQTAQSRDDEVHEARKRCKRLRALLRLVRDHLGTEVYRYENVAIRDASRLVAPVRDAQVLVTTLDDTVSGTVSGASGQLDVRAVAETRRALKAAHSRLRQQTLYRGTASEQAAVALLAVQRRSHDWPLSDLQFDDLQLGLARVYRRGRTRMAEAYGDPTPERFHDWRKRVKYLWHHLELLQPAWPGMLDALAQQTHDLSDLLGDEHDRTVLEQTLRERPDMLANQDVAQALMATLDEQREHLRAVARPLGAKVYTETPEQFTERIACYWQSGSLAA
jgi:CHAD domain-containing protein